MSAPKNARIALYISIVITVILWAGFIPFSGIVAKPLFLLSTFFHELGHAIAALRHSVESIGVNWDGSGITWSAGPPNANLAGAWISAGGLIGPAITSRYVYDGQEGANESYGFRGIWPRDATGRRAIRAKSLRIYLRRIFRTPISRIGTQSRNKFSRFVMIFIATQLSLTVFTRADYLFSSNPASDVQQMAQSLFLPYWVWGLLCGTISVVILFLGLRQYVKLMSTSRLCTLRLLRARVK